jgi:hypothetical protein
MPFGIKQKEWKCPNCKQWVQPKLMVFQGLFGMPNSLGICQQCGIVFDTNIAEKRDKP